MPEGYLAYIQPLTGNHPDQGLPGLSPGSPSHPIAPGGGGSPSHPIYHPGHPDHGLPAHPDQGLPPGSPGQPSHPIAGQPPAVWPGPQPGHPIAMPPGGQPVPPGTINPGPVPPQFANQAVVAVHLPGQDWQVKTYPVEPSQGQPTPTPRR